MDEQWDWPSAMRAVAARFRGEEGVYLQFGDSLTLASPNQQWATRGLGHTEAERAFLRWAHAGRRDSRDGWYLASAATGPPDEPPRARTAGVGCSSRVLLMGGRGLPRLLQMIAEFRPQLALYAVGMSDILRDTPCDEYVGNVAAAVDLLLEHAVVPIISTITPARGRDAQVADANAALRALARTRCVPLLDIHAQMQQRSPDVLSYLDDDGVHLTWDPPIGPPTPENLLKSGYLLRCCLTVRKGMEVCERVLEPLPTRPIEAGRQ